MWVTNCATRDIAQCETTVQGPFKQSSAPINTKECTPKGTHTSSMTCCKCAYVTEYGVNAVAVTDDPMRCNGALSVDAFPFARASLAGAAVGDPLILQGRSTHSIELLSIAGDYEWSFMVFSNHLDLNMEPERI